MFNLVIVRGQFFERRAVEQSALDPRTSGDALSKTK
ncbi:hypothetical protein N601_17620 [Rhodococcus erythropolis DN1]|nr:hypothetical protein N601_17620 [Rhodococcus erythropolis DN1]